jgi:hypothetical protein
MTGFGFEPAPFAGRIHVARGGSDGGAALFLADADREGRHWVRQLSEDELAVLAQEAADALAAGPPPLDRDAVLASMSAARHREAALPALRAARQAGES